MSRASSSDLAGIQATRLEVRNDAGELVTKVNRSQAEELIALGLASPIGRRSVRYLLLQSGVRSPFNGSTGGSKTIRSVRADQTCTSHQAGQLISPRALFEHKPLIQD